MDIDIYEYRVFEYSLLYGSISLLRYPIASNAFQYIKFVSKNVRWQYEYFT
jgi:hypothetical protein